MDAAAMKALQSPTGRAQLDGAENARHKAVRTAEQFESLFVRQLVSCMRQTASFGDEGGMFGSGPGSDTYTDWFDQNMADSITRSDRVGIKERIVSDLERWGQLQPEQMQKVQLQARAAAMAGDRSAMRAAIAVKGGVNVTQ